MLLKLPRLVLFISREAYDAKEKPEFAKLSDFDIILKLILYYVNQYEIVDILYRFMLEINFDTRQKNILPSIQSIFEQNALKYEAFELTKDNVFNIN